MRARNEIPYRRKGLRVQADVPHTFGPLLLPLAAILVVWGIFLVERTVKHPLESDAVSILFGSVLLACGLLLLSYLLRSIRFSTAWQPPRERSVKRPAPRPVSRRAVVPTKTAPPSRPFHRFYVDDVRISR